MHIPFVRRGFARSVAGILWLASMCAMHAHAAGVVGTGTAASCTEAAFDTALTGGGSITFSCGGTATITLTATKDLTVDTDINGGGLITLDGNNTLRHFSLGVAASLQLTGLSLINGHAAGNGGAILASSGTSLVLTNVVLNNNQSLNNGGAIYTATALTLNRVVASNNHSANGAGAIAFTGNSLSIANSTFSSNSATVFGAGGGAVAVLPATTTSLSVVNSTFYDNGGGNSTTGGALTLRGVSGGTINNSTFAGNKAQGALELFGSSTVTLTNSIVSATVTNQNCFISANSTLSDGGNNLQFGGTISQSCGAGITQADPKLGPLANNGGFTSTMALLAGSPAIDAGSDATCAATDQRGVARPIGTHCDIGAYEAPVSAIAPAIINGPPPGGSVGAAYSFTYTATGSAPISFAVPPAALPPGLALSSAGVISGTPTTPGIYTGTVTANNGTQPNASQPFSITIAPSTQPPVAATVTAPLLGMWGMLSMIALLIAFASRHKRPGHDR
jgi:predicted outer membrane repeat protein